jgi:hypothetical protein
MSPEIRELLAILEFIQNLGNAEMNKRINKIVPLFELLGFARWQRDTVTDMAIRKSIKRRKETWGQQNVRNPTVPNPTIDATDH